MKKSKFIETQIMYQAVNLKASSITLPRVHSTGEVIFFCKIS